MKYHQNVLTSDIIKYCRFIVIVFSICLRNWIRPLQAPEDSGLSNPLVPH